MARIDFMDALEQWYEKNDQGEGYGIGEEDDSLHDAIHREGWVVLMSSQGALLCDTGHGDLAMVCNANGPWAVNLEENEQR